MIDPLALLLGIGLGAVAGGVIVGLALHLRFAHRRLQLESELRASQARLEEYKSFQDETARRLTDTFNSLASEALSRNSESFLQLARQALETKLTQAQGELEVRKQAVEHLVRPLAQKLDEMEQQRQKAYGGLEQLMKSVTQAQEVLARETRNLGQALRSPQTRGRWGEMTLRRVAELAGMVERCDFYEQHSFSADGKVDRPDMIVRLPNHRLIAVDAKTPLDAYLQAIEAGTDAEREDALARHARQLQQRVQDLSSKSYWRSVEHTPEFVVLFLPGEFILGPALRHYPDLLERAMRDRVVVATPSTLIALLHTVAYGWRQEQLAENARQISSLGRELYERLITWAGHMGKLGESLEKSVKTFNESVGSLESRVLVSARRFKELGVSETRDIPVLEPVDQSLRKLSASDLAHSPPSLDGAHPSDGSAT